MRSAARDGAIPIFPEFVAVFAVFYYGSRWKTMPVDVERILRIFFHALGAAGLPGASLAADVVNLAIDGLKKHRAWEEAKEALAWAEEAFREEARQRGWERLAEALLQQPLHDLPFLEKAIRAALATGDPGALEAELREEMKAIPGVEDPESAAHAARLYITSVLDALWRIEALRDAVRDVLFKEHVEALRRLEEKLDRFLEWWRLPRVRERLPREELVHGPQRDIGFAALKAPLALVPFTGKRHRALRDELVEWARSLGGSPGRAGLRVLCGPGGAGKTRLAVETAAVLLGQGWEAFFLTPELLRLREPQKDLMPVLRHLFVPPRPTLYVVDYVDHLPEAALRAVFRALYETGGSRGRPVALIFLMRPRPDPEWLGELIGLAEAEPGFSTFLTGTVLPAFNGAEEVPELSPDDRVSLFERAKEAFIALREEAPGESVGYPPEALPQRPLAIVLLGLLAAYGRRVPQSKSEMAVLEHVWDCWEKDKWSKVLRRNGGLSRELIADALDHIEVALIAATLGRKFRTPGEVAAFWKGHYPFRRRDPTGRAVDPDWLAGVLPDLFPSLGPGSRWLLPPIAPDPLADLVLARRGDLGELARAALPTAEELREAWGRLRDVLARSRKVDIEEVRGYPFFVAPFRALPVLRRLFDVHPEAGRLLARALADWLEETARDLPKEAAALWLGLWEHHLPEGPEHTVALRELFVAYYRARLHWATEDHDRALWFNNLGVALSALGRHGEALEATREAVDLYRELVKKNPDRFLPDLATSLNNLGNCLSALGRHGEALEATREAVNIYRELVKKNPDRFLPDLATSLNNLGAFLSALGRHVEALEATREAVNIYRELVKKNPDRFLPDLATSLNNLGIRLSALGRHGEALEATREAVDLYRQLAQKNPDRFLPDLATSLNNLGIRLSALGRHGEALEATREAVDLYRQLAQKNPDRFLPDLATSLNNLGNCLSALGRHGEALGATREAVEIRRQLAQKNPDRFLPDLARSLGAHGYALLGAGRAPEAAEAFREGLGALIPHARRLPRAFGPLLVALLRDYLRACEAAGRAPDDELVREAEKVLEENRDQR